MNLHHRTDKHNTNTAVFTTLYCLYLLVCVGCATHADHVRNARNHFHSGNIISAKSDIDEELKKGKKKNSDVLKLDQSIIELFSGEPQNAKTSLREVRDSFEYLEQKNAAEDVLAMLSDENAVQYPGEDYEKIMIRVMLTLADLMDGGEDATAYATQINLKQDAIIRNGGIKYTSELPNKPNVIPKKPESDLEYNPKTAYKHLAIGPYLHGLIREETLVNYDDAFRDYRLVSYLEPTFTQGLRDLDRVQNGRHSARGNGVLYVFAFTGKGPYKERDEAEATQFSLLIADRIFSATNKYSVPPTVAPVPIPKIVAPYNRIDSIGVSSDGQPIGRTDTITNISRIAHEQFEATKHMIIARAVMRRVVKKGTIYAAKEIADVNPWISLAMDAGGVIWEATETADTRCWGLLPEKIQVLRLELPEGEHRIELQPLGSGGTAIGAKHAQNVVISRGRNSYMLANFPNEKPVGKIQVH